MGSPEWRADPPEVLIRALTAIGRTVATCESLTGGLVAATLTSVPGSSAAVRGGLIVYATDLKHSVAGVDAELLRRVGPVDPEVAVAMAAGARRLCGADYGLGLTGVAGPDPQDGKSVGTVFVAIAGPERDWVRPIDAGPAGRERIRAIALNQALVMLTRELREFADASEHPDRGGNICEQQHVDP